MKFSKLNLAKLNYILIPSTREERERFQKSRSRVLFLFLLNFFFLFSREGRVLLLCWMLAAAISINIGFTQYYVVWSVLSGLLLASLLLRRGVRLKDVSLSFDAPQRVTLGDPVHFVVECRNQGKLTHQAIRIERPFLLWDGSYLSPRVFIENLGPEETCSCSIVAKFVARGEHYLDAVSARALAPLGLALSPAIFSQRGVQFLVVPRIANVTHVDVDTTQKYQPGGVALASIMGESRELIGVRPYRPGDPIRDIHAKTWARIGAPVVLEYRQEYFTRIGIIIDTDQGQSDDPVFESMLSLAAGIVAQLSRGEALLDLLVIGEDFHQLTLGRSLGFLEQALDLLACVEPKQGFRSEFLQSQLRGHLSRLSCIVVLSMHWDKERQQFSDWIEQRGIRCRRVNVIEKNEPEYATSVGATMIKVAEIQKEELVV